MRNACLNVKSSKCAVGINYTDSELRSLASLADTDTDTDAVAVALADTYSC